MTETYSEQRQKILFRASRELRKVAAQVLDDVQNPVELQSRDTIRWAVQLARRTAERANALEWQAHEECIGSSRQEGLIAKSRDEYSAAIDRFEARVKAQPGGALHLANAKVPVDTHSIKV